MNYGGRGESLRLIFTETIYKLILFWIVIQVNPCIPFLERRVRPTPYQHFCRSLWWGSVFFLLVRL